MRRSLDSLPLPPLPAGQPVPSVGSQTLLSITTDIDLKRAKGEETRGLYPPFPLCSPESFSKPWPSSCLHPKGKRVQVGLSPPSNMVTTCCLLVVASLEGQFQTFSEKYFLPKSLWDSEGKREDNRF